MKAILLNIFLAICALFCVESQAQQLSTFTQYRANSGLLNPAALNQKFIRADNDQYPTTHIGVSYRHQWLGLGKDVSPVNYMVQAEHLFSFKKGFKLNIGGHLLKDDINPLCTIDASLRLGAYKKIGEYSGLSIGFSATYLGFQLRENAIQAFHVFDPTLTSENNQQSIYSLGFGVYFHTRRNGKSLFVENSENEQAWDRLYFGFSIPQFYSGLFSPQTEGDTDKIPYTLNKHLYFNAGFIAYTGGENFIDVSIWYKNVATREHSIFDFFNAPRSFDANIRYYHRYNRGFSLWGGLGLGIHSAFGMVAHFEFGFRLKNDFNIGVGIDHHFAFPGAFANSIELNFSKTFYTRK